MSVQKSNKSSKVIIPNKRLLRLIVVISLVIVMGIIAGWVILSGKPEENNQERTDYTSLIGDWVRPDGDYTIRISGFDNDSEIKLGYFNPRSINVAKANVLSQNDTITLFIELRDQGYPGSKYDLVYSPDEDVLKGTYFQAQIQQLYNVVFYRK